jgi:hypothetical protein|tara:strand:+ start:646 stop:933 length:288 start_codon:yes stop_codon:yes gene_type:complete
MFEAFVYVCLIGAANVCHTLQDLEGPYKTEKQCVSRAYEIAMDLPDFMPSFVAVKYKCLVDGETIQGKIRTNHDTEKEKGQFKGIHHQEWRQETH